MAINRIIDRLEAINTTKSKIGMPYREDKRMIDMRCLREALINAIAHNDWISKNPPTVFIYSDRIEIISTGGLPIGLSREEFFNGISKPRNQELMRVLSDLKYVERTGYVVLQILRIYGEDAFEITKNFIKVTFKFDN